MATSTVTTSANHKAIVVGATGHLGVAVVEELSTRNVPVVAVARHQSASLEQFVASGNENKKEDHARLQVAFVDALHPSTDNSYTKVFAVHPQITTAVSCLASQDDFWAVDRDATIRFGRAALQAGVRHVILVATFEGRDSRCMSDFSNAKEEAVDVLRHDCEMRGVTFTVIRPNAYFKDLTEFAFDSVLAHNQHTVLGTGLCRINPIAREDVARFMVDCIQDRRGGEFPVGGPDTYSFCEIGVLAADVIFGTNNNHNALRIRHIPLWSLRLLGGVLDLVGRVSRAARRKAAFLHWMVYVSTHDDVAPCCGQRHLRDEYETKLKQTRVDSEPGSGKSSSATTSPSGTF